MLEGDEWKYDKPPVAMPRTRAEQQMAVNNMFVTGFLSLTEWRAATDELSEPTKWTAKGQIHPKDSNALTRTR